MRIISIRRLQEFWKIHSMAERSLRAWFSRVERAQWQNFAEVRREFPTADQVKRLTVFNISGNNYRLITRIEFDQQKVFIRNVLTHAEYDEGKWKDDNWYT